MAGGCGVARLASYGGGFSCSMLRHAGLGWSLAVAAVAAASNELDAFRFSLGRPRKVEKLNVDELVLVELVVEVMAAVAEGAFGEATTAVGVQLVLAGAVVVVVACCSRADGSSLMASS